MQEVVLARVACALCSLVWVSLTLLLIAVSLASTWWTPAPTAQQIVGVTEQDRQQAAAMNLGGDDDTLNSEISLWAHIGCAGNESWTDICSLGPEDCRFAAPTTTEYVEWVPVVMTTTTPPIPTYDPWRPTTTPPPPGPDWACATGSPNCQKPPTTTEDPLKWGKTPETPGDGVDFGDDTARIIDEGTVTNERPRISADASTRPTTTTAFVPKRAPIGRKPGEDEAVTPPPVDTPHSIWDEVNDKYFPAGNPITTGPIATEYDALAAPKRTTTTGQQAIPGVAEVVGYCALVREGDKARMFVCGLQAQCQPMGEARRTVIAAVVFQGLALLAMIAFGGGGGGRTTPTREQPEGDIEPTRHTIGFAASGFCALSSAMLVAGLGLASGVKVPHSMDGLGTVCAGVAVVSSAIAALTSGCAAALAKIFPGRELTLDEAANNGAKMEADPDIVQKVLEEDFPGLKDKAERPLALRIAWSAATWERDTPSEPQTCPPPAQPACRPPADDLDSLPMEDLESPSEGQVGTRMLVLPPNIEAASPTQERSLQRYLEGEGAVYAHRLFGSSSQGFYGAARTSSEPCSTASGMQSMRSELGGWESALAGDGEVYYFNRETGETQWEPPLSLPGSPLCSDAGGQFGTPMGSSFAGGAMYKKKKSKKTGQVYSVRVR